MKSLTAGLSQAQYAAIGKVANEWSHVDAILRHCISVAGKIKARVADKITANLGSSQLYELLLTLLHDGTDGKQSPLYEHLSEARRRFDELREKRNSIVHLDWVWTRHGEAGALKVRGRGKWVAKTEKWTTRQMEALPHEIKAFADVLWQHLLNSEAGRLAPLPPKPNRRGTRRRTASGTHSGRPTG